MGRVCPGRVSPKGVRGDSVGGGCLWGSVCGEDVYGEVYVGRVCVGRCAWPVCPQQGPHLGMVPASVGGTDMTVQHYLEAMVSVLCDHRWSSHLKVRPKCAILEYDVGHHVGCFHPDYKPSAVPT